MKMYLYLGCTTPAKQYAYELSLRAVFPRLGIELVDMPDSNCCGTPLMGVNRFYNVYAPARLMAIAEAGGLDIVAPCNGCHLALSEAAFMLRERRHLLEQVNSLLKEEGLKYTGKVKVYHPVEVLYGLVGVEKISSAISNKLPPLKFACHPGCHLVRPSHIGRPEKRDGKLKLEALTEAIGLQTRDHPEKYECCGAAMIPYSTDAAIKTVAMRIKRFVEGGFDGVTTLCPYCFDMIDGKQDAAKTITGDRSLSIPTFYYTQLLGLAMGISERELGLNLNMSPVGSVLEKLRR